jgi:hypothetical protein
VGLFSIPLIGAPFLVGSAYDLTLIGRALSATSAVANAARRSDWWSSPDGLRVPRTCQSNAVEVDGEELLIFRRNVAVGPGSRPVRAAVE